MAECRLLEKKADHQMFWLFQKVKAQLWSSYREKGISTTHSSLKAMCLSPRTVKRCLLKFCEILAQPSPY